MQTRSTFHPKSFTITSRHPVTYIYFPPNKLINHTGLPVFNTIILSTVIPSTLVLLMLVCTVVVIILIVSWRVTRKQVDAAHEHFEMSTREASTVGITTTTSPPGTDDFYIINEHCS